MTSDTPPDPQDETFRTWLRSLSEDLDTDPESALASQDALAFLWSAFVDNGAMPSSYVAPLLSAHRQAHAQQAVTAMLKQVTRKPDGDPTSSYGTLRPPSASRKAWSTSGRNLSRA